MLTDVQTITAFLDGKEGNSKRMTAKVIKGSNNAISVLYSDNVVLAYKWNGQLILTSHKYCVTTTNQTNKALALFTETGRTIIRDDLHAFSPLAKLGVN